jgi:hypothetical protein
MPTGLVTVAAVPIGPYKGFGTSSDACDVVTDPKGNPDPTGSNLKLTLRLLGNAGKKCGFGSAENCPIEGVALCGSSINNNATLSSPLNVVSPDGFGQSDGKTNFAAFRLQVTSEQQSMLCKQDTFQAFIARAGFFEACVTVLDSQDNPITTYCNQQFCTVDLDDIQSDSKDDGPLIYKCKQP